MTECVSCGGKADPKSPRDFCAKCDKEFEAGLKHSEEAAARAEKLEQAKEDGDEATVGKIMAEIAVEAHRMDKQQKAGK